MLLSAKYCQMREGLTTEQDKWQLTSYLIYGGTVQTINPWGTASFINQMGALACPRPQADITLLEGLTGGRL